MINNLNQLKKALQPGAKFTFLSHWREDSIGAVRVVNKVNSVAVYSYDANNPDSPINRANGGDGYELRFWNANRWTFNNGIATFYNTRHPGRQPEQMFALKLLEV